MKVYVKCSLAVAALALLAFAPMASAQAPRASDKARGYYGPAASPDPADATWLAPGVTGQRMTGRATGPGVRSYSYAPAPRTVQPAAPQAVTPRPRAARPAPQPRAVQPAPRAVQPAPRAAAAPAPAAATPVRRYSYQPAPTYRYQGWRNDRVLSGNPANRDAAAKANGEY